MEATGKMPLRVIKIPFFIVITFPIIKCLQILIKARLKPNDKTKPIADV